VIGKSYTLHVVTADGNVYESEQYLMYPVPDIVSIYFSKEQEIVNNGTEPISLKNWFLQNLNVQIARLQAL
jgi:hypothetical protein